MQSRGNIPREIDSTHYSAGQVKTIVKSIGLNLFSEVGDQIAFYCPFHNNTHTPSCSINESSGAWICFNPSCSESGTILDLVKRVMQINDFQALRLIMSHGKIKSDAFEDELNAVLDDKPEFEEFPQETLNRLHAGLFENQEAKLYLISRGINEESIKHFGLGFSGSTNMVITPVHSPEGIPVGLVGRSISDKKFKNSNNLPKSKTLFNIHRAKRIGSNVIIVESNFDAIRVHQAGFPNVVATLGGHMSPNNLNLLNRYFNKIIIMTDSDSAGRELGNSIASRLRNKDILWASHEYGKIYPHEAKDAGDMTDEEIKSCINNSVSNIEYQSWVQDKTK